MYSNHRNRQQANPRAHDAGPTRTSEIPARRTRTKERPEERYARGELHVPARRTRQDEHRGLGACCTIGQRIGRDIPVTSSADTQPEGSSEPSARIASVTTAETIASLPGRTHPSGCILVCNRAMVTRGNPSDTAPDPSPTF